MLAIIKKRIEQELKSYVKSLDALYSLKKISPVILTHINEFISRDGKRVRPMLFVLGYRGFSNKNPRGLYRSALSIELLHDFMLVHDDIIDKSETRRGKPSMHAMLNRYLTRYKGIKFNGQDLTIVAGDIIYAMGLDAFMSIDESPLRKEKALKILIAAALYTGCGEFIELIDGARDIKTIKKEDIYKIYDYKTAYYTFAAPLALGATLAGAPASETKKLIGFGIQMGRAFQVKDDLIGMFSEEKEIGKSVLTDLQEAKKTFLIWYAYNHSASKIKKEIRSVLGKQKITYRDLEKMRCIVKESGAYEYARNEVNLALKQAKRLLSSSRMKSAVKTLLKNYCEKILSV